MSSLAPTLALDRAHGAERSRAVVDIRSRVGMMAATAVLVIAPFEVVLFTIPGGFTVTTVEAAMTLALLVFAVTVAGSPTALSWPKPLVRPGAVFLTVLLVSALAAPTEQGNALRFVARMAAAAALCVMFVNLAESVDRVRWLIRVHVVVATVIALVAVLEAAQVPGVMRSLTVFRPGFHVVGGQLRATSTLFYPTIASMYLETAFALGLWLLLGSTTPSLTTGRWSRLERPVVFVALTIIGAGISSTFTRAGLAGMAAALALVAGVCLARLPRPQVSLGTLASLAAVLMTIVFLSHSPQLLATRMSTEGSHAWYGARYEVPKTLRLTTGRTHQIPIALTNTGRLTWDSRREPAFAMSYHWLRAGSDAVIQFEGDRTPFSSPVVPGAKVTLPVSVTAPGEAGTYTLVWDAVHESRAWLSTEGVESPRTDVRVEGAKSGAVVTKMDRLPRASMRPARPALWGAALRIAADWPWLGVGPDNYRHAYGGYLGLERWDKRVHANNMYLELLAGAGIVGLAAFMWLVTSAGLALWRRCRRIPVGGLTAAVAVLAAWLMIAGHGLVDSFLGFTTTYVTFAFIAGLAFSPGLTGYTGRNADRI